MTTLSLTVEERVAKTKRLLRAMIIGLTILVAGISFVAFYMSYAVLRDMGTRASIPADVAWGLPVVIDGSIVAAILVILAWRLCGRTTLWPWIVLIAFSAVSIVGNGAHTAIAQADAQSMPMWLALMLGAIPPIGLLTSCEMIVRLPKASDVAAAVQAAAIAEALDTATDTVEIVVPEPEIAAQPVVVVEASVATLVPAVATLVPAVATTIPGAEAPVAEPVLESDSIPVVADMVETDADSADDTANQMDAPSAPITQLHRVESLPTTKAERIGWIVDQARAENHISTKEIAELFGVTDRTVQRFVKEARQQAPEAFAEAIDTEALEQVS